MDVLEMDLRFDQRVLAFHAYVNTARDHGPMVKQMQRVAGGPRLDAEMCWLEGYQDGRTVWADMIRERGLANPPALREGSPRVLVVHLFVNTDADPYHIHKGILRIARGDRLDACVCWAELFEREDGRKAWEVCQDFAKRAAADPKSKPYER